MPCDSSDDALVPSHQIAFVCIQSSCCALGPCERLIFFKEEMTVVPPQSGDICIKAL